MIAIEAVGPLAGRRFPSRQPGLHHRLPGGNDGDLAETRCAPKLLGPEVLLQVEVLDLPGNLSGDVVSEVALQRSDAGLALYERVIERVDAVGDGVDRAHAGNDHAGLAVFHGDPSTAAAARSSSGSLERVLESDSPMASVRAATRSLRTASTPRMIAFFIASASERA